MRQTHPSILFPSHQNEQAILHLGLIRLLLASYPSLNLDSPLQSPNSFPIIHLVIYLDKYCTIVLSLSLIVSLHSRRRTLSPAAPSASYPHPTQFPKSHQIISFADPHPLTSLESYRFRNRGRGPIIPLHPAWFLRSGCIYGARDLLFLYLVTSLRRCFNLERLIHVPQTKHRSSVPIPERPRPAL